MVTIGQHLHFVTFCDQVITVAITAKETSITINGNGQDLSYEYVDSTSDNGAELFKRMQKYCSTIHIRPHTAQIGTSNVYYRFEEAKAKAMDNVDKALLEINKKRDALVSIKNDLLAY
jgi:hypothetical protein